MKFVRLKRRGGVGWGGVFVCVCVCVCVGDGGVCCVYGGPHIEGPPQHQCKCQCHCEVWLNIVAKAKADYCESSLLPREMPSKTSDSNLADGLTQVHKQQKTQKKALPKVSRSHAQEALARKRARKTVAIE